MDIFNYLSSEALSNIKAKIDNHINDSAQFASEESEMKFRKLAQLWLSLKYIMTDYRIVYENYYNLNNASLFITSDKVSEGPFLLLSFKLGNSVVSVLEADAYKNDFSDESEDFKMDFEDKNIEYFKSNLAIYKKSIDVDSMIEELSRKFV